MTLPNRQRGFIGLIWPVLSAVKPTFEIPLGDAGSGAVDLNTARGNGPATFTRATAAYTTLSSGLLASVLSGVARSNYSAAGAYLGYLAEGQRTNLCVQSQTLGTTWTTSQAAITVDQYVGPDGTTTADRIAPAATTSNHFAQQGGLALSATTYTYSVYLRYVANRWVSLQLFDGTSSFNASFDLQNGVVGAVGANTTSRIEATATANVYRCSITATTAATAAGVVYIILNNANSAASVSWAAVGTEYVGAWGAQLEASSFASTYIPTVGATVTRNFDNATYPVSGNLPTNNATISFSWTPAAASQGTVFLWASYVDASNYTAILHDGTNIIFRKRIAGVNTDATKALTYVAGTTYRITARASDSLGQDIFVDGVKGTNNTTTTAMQLGSSFQLGADGNSASPQFGSFKSLRIYTRALDDGKAGAL